MTDCAGTNTIAALLAGAIDSGAAQRLEHHLDACATCRRLVADLGRGLSAIGEGVGAGGGLPQIGDRVGRFEIARVIGVGGMGVVFEARDPALERRVAVKLLRPDIVAGDVLLGEAQAMARLQHPNIAVVHDVGRFGGQLYVCMEYIAGTTLRAWLAERAPSWREIARVFVAAGRGLAYVHAAGLVHRDFKPDNVLIARDGRVVVTDFGLAHVVDHARGGVVGTPAYMAPEQRRGDPVDARADQYAFCAALREAVRGHAPGWLNRVIARGLEPRAADRFATMDALLVAIEARLRARRPLVRIGVVAAAVGLTALAVPRARDVVTRVIDRPVVERVVEARPSLPAAGPGEPDVELAAAPTAGGSPDVVAAVEARAGSTPATRTRAWDRVADAAATIRAISAARPALTPFELPGGFTPIASCDDGSERTCALDEPACPPSTIASIQGGCWTCADDHTCMPLGLPHACDDGTKLTCTIKPPSCEGHDVPSVHDGCWRCEDPFSCRARPLTGAQPPHHNGRCGNGVCEAGEDPMTCPTDCHGTGSGGGSGHGSNDGSGSQSLAPVCGNGMCEVGEDHASCPSDCCEVRPDGSCAPVCGNGFCEVGEDHASCPADCRS